MTVKNRDMSQVDAVFGSIDENNDQISFNKVFRFTKKAKIENFNIF
jgi:hypothetical protein